MLSTSTHLVYVFFHPFSPRLEITLHEMTCDGNNLHLFTQVPQVHEVLRDNSFGRGVPRLWMSVCHVSAAVAFSLGANITSTHPLPRQWPSHAVFHCRRPKNVTMRSRRAQASCRGHGNPQGKEPHTRKETTITDNAGFSRLFLVHHVRMRESCLLLRFLLLPSWFSDAKRC